MKILVILLLLYQTAEERSAAVVAQFQKDTGHPNGWSMHVVDHKIPLCAGGPDTIDNLQWQELKASYTKDNFERALCAEMKRQGLVMVKK